MYALTDLRKENFVDKRYWEKSCKYSIRKLSIGAASILLGAVFLAAQGVTADGIEIPESEATITETSAKPDTKVEEVLVSNTETQPVAESAEKQTNPGTELPQTSSQSETSATTAPADNKESEKPELPVNKQEHYELHYNQPTAPSLILYQTFLMLYVLHNKVHSFQEKTVFDFFKIMLK